MARVSTTGWYGLSARHSSRELLVAPEWEGMPELGPWLLDDGRDAYELVMEGRQDELGFPVWFRQVEGSRDKRRGDMLAGSGLGLKVVSRRLVDALEELGALDGVRTFPVELRDRRMRRIDADYLGLLEPIGHGEVRARMPEWRTWDLVVSARVLDGLRERGVTELKVEPDVDPTVAPEPLPEPTLADVVIGRGYLWRYVADDAVPEDQLLRLPGDRALRDVLTFDGRAMGESLEWAVLMHVEDEYFPLDRVLEGFDLLGMDDAATMVRATARRLRGTTLEDLPPADEDWGSGHPAWDAFSSGGLDAAAERMVELRPELFDPEP
ncbi:hypothetical protein QE364_002403 [Nocardioides zeae]|uniref:Uncharacterized protein n=1 Tax=Nocardioides zeae TaxID=1457234 RepID=A0ACC6IJ80_9ACTN|nr:hypothetical protein [Nocardioides zeae]MDR6174617.1 hypothetical protein [Nocardioides zeae]MDR6210688.1 hypothetical protein [Nocardioides zeae]